MEKDRGASAKASVRSSAAAQPASRSLIGQRIRVQKYTAGYPTHQEDYTVEEFRHCPGIFLSDAHRKAGDFTPLCDLYDPAPGSERGYIPNYGEYYAEWVQAWMDLPTDRNDSEDRTEAEGKGEAHIPPPSKE